VTLTFDDLDALKDAAIKRFDERLAQTDPSLCYEFDAEVARLESQLEQLYAVTASLARNEPTVEKTADLWERMVQICDEFAGRVIILSEEHPSCKASYDRMLDVRCAAKELADLHSA
jgi:hypothetical protein